MNEEILQKEAAEILGVSPGTVCLHLKRHMLPKIRKVAEPHLKRYVEGVVNVIGTVEDRIVKLSEKVDEKIDNAFNGRIFNGPDFKAYSSEEREWIKLYIALLKVSGFFVQE